MIIKGNNDIGFPIIFICAAAQVFRRTADTPCVLPPISPKRAQYGGFWRPMLPHTAAIHRLLTYAGDNLANMDDIHNCEHNQMHHTCISSDI